MGKHKTWAEAKLIADQFGAQILNAPESGKVFNTQKSGFWNIKCKCGKIWSPVLNAFLRGDSKTCNKCNLPTYSQVFDELSRNFEVIQVPGILSEFIKNVRSELWVLKCKCGKIIQRTTVAAREIISCGCAKQFNIDNQRFGRLIALYRDGNEYVCKCDCGNAYRVRASNLINGDSVSCGCKRRENALNKVRKFKVGDKINEKLTFVEYLGIGGNKHNSLFKFNCECGGTWTGPSYMFKNIKSCGCIKSEIESELFDFIKSLINIPIRRRDRTAIKPKELDIYIPDLNLAIELDGLYWHSEKHLQSRNYHKHSSYQKFKLCQKNGIRLITIYEDEWKNNKEVVKGYLKSILGKKNSVGARKCKIVRQDVSDFLNQNHLQGAGVNSSNSYALYYGDKIVGGAVFVKTGKRKDNGQDVYELTRYCTTSDLSIAGGLSRIISHFVKDVNCSKIISYSDNRWSIGNLYERAGFIKNNQSRPSYSYVKNHKREHRFKWRKEMALSVYGGSENETEYEIMSRNGWDRIWDCGKTRWELICGPQSK